MKKPRYLLAAAMPSCYAVYHFRPRRSFVPGSKFPASGISSLPICSALLTLRRQSTMSNKAPTLPRTFFEPQPTFLSFSCSRLSGRRRHATL